MVIKIRIVVTWGLGRREPAGWWKCSIDLDGSHTGVYLHKNSFNCTL